MSSEGEVYILQLMDFDQFCVLYFFFNFVMVVVMGDDSVKRNH